MEKNSMLDSHKFIQESSSPLLREHHIWCHNQREQKPCICSTARLLDMLMAWGKGKSNDKKKV